LGAPVEYGPTFPKVVHARGFDWMIHGAPSNPSGFGGDNSIGCLRLGGWSNLEPGLDTQTITTDRRGPFQVGWADIAGGATDPDSICWTPFDTPDAGGNAWAQFGATAGVISAGATGEAMRINLATTDGGYEYPLDDGDPVTLYCSTQARSAGGAGSLSLLQHGIELVLVDGAGLVAAHVELRILNVTELRFRVRDIQAGVDLFELPVNTDFIDHWQVQTDPFLEFWLEATTGTISLWYRRTDSVLWLEALDGAALVTGAIPAGGAAIRFGATDATGTVDQLWRAFYFLESTEQDPRRWDAGREPLGAQISGLPFPLVQAGTGDEDEALVSFRGGPASHGEVHTIAPIHDFGVPAAMWDAGPSRSERWRDTGSGSVDRVLTWTFPEATRLDGSWVLGLVVLDANFPIANLEVDLVGGGAGWTQVATLQLYSGFTDLHYERDGDILHPGTLEPNTDDAVRFINRGEFVGGIARWGSSTGGIASARILANGAGGWADKSVNTIHPYLRVDSSKVAGTSTVSEGTIGPAFDDLRIQAPSGLVVSYLDAGQFIHGVRVVIPPASTPEGYREAGLIMPCAFSAFGQQWSRGYSLDTRPNVIRDVSRQGTIRKREEGPPATRVSFAWPDGVKLDAMRAGLEVDYLGPSGKPAVVADSDVWGQLRGVLEETRSGEIPVVYVAELPRMAGPGPTSVTLTDRSLWGFGTLDGSARFDHVLGDEGVNEYGRVAGVQVTGIE
jgi:hypothetical protein